MKKIILGAIFSLFVVVYFVSCSDDPPPLPTNEVIVPVDGTVPDRTELDQSWTGDDRMAFWFTSQGSEIIKYSWFTWLKQADNDAYFRNTEHMEMLGYLPMKSSKLNPSGLPVGFSITRGGTYEEASVGLTCAACHTNQINYEGEKILVEGAPTLANFVLFFDRLSEALNETHSNDEKFDEFAHKVLGDTYSEATAADLRTELESTALAVAERIQVNALPADYPADYTSFGRLDAFGNIENAVSAFGLNDLGNKNAPAAPVSYPFLWGTHQSDVVQWNGSANNRIPIVGPISRNVGEVVGVFGDLSIKKQDKVLALKYKYNATVDYHGIGALEGYIKKLRSPQWPESTFPKIDNDLAAKGAVLFGQHCQSCHQVIAREDEGNNYVANKTALVDIGTDPQTATQIYNHEAKTLILEDSKESVLVGKKFGPTSKSITLVTNSVAGLIIENPIQVVRAAEVTKRVGRSATARGGDPIQEVEDEMARREQEILTDLGLDGSRAGNVDELVKAELAKRSKDTINKYLSLTTEITIPSDGIPKTPEAQIKAHLLYKGRPLNGIWATAPFLHNGSVPNLWQLLQAPDKRVTSFWVGSAEFDPKNVGFVTDKGKNEFKVLKSDGKTVMSGNGNGGHIYGTELSDEEKWQLVEYMKTL